MASYTKTYYITRTKFLWSWKLIQSVFIHNLTLSSEKSAAILLQKDKNVKWHMTLPKITSEPFWTVYDNVRSLDPWVELRDVSSDELWGPDPVHIRREHVPKLVDSVKIALAKIVPKRKNEEQNLGNQNKRRRVGSAGAASNTGGGSIGGNGTGGGGGGEVGQRGDGGNTSAGGGRPRGGGGASHRGGGISGRGGGNPFNWSRGGNTNAPVLPGRRGGGQASTSGRGSLRGWNRWYRALRPVPLY
jgi:hypothetical protein